ncbi:MAG: hypothetical protein ACFFE8_06850 [Candidatus Heimdallarchaeota archaeon]
MSQQTLKEFGLEFINEMTQDRKRAHEEIGAALSATKSRFVDQSPQQFSYQDLNNFVKQVRESTGKIVDTELTRLTLKSLGRIRDFIQGKQLIVPTPNEKRPKETLKVPRPDPNLQALRERLKSQEKIIENLTIQRDQTQEIFDMNQTELNRLQDELNRLKNRLEHLQDQETLYQQRLDGLVHEVNVKSALIETLKKRELIREKDVEEALQSVAETYKIQENYYQKMVEEELQQRVGQIRLGVEEEFQEKLVQVRSEKEEELRKQALQIRNETKSWYDKEIHLREKHYKTMMDQLEEERQDLKKHLEEVSAMQHEQNLLVDYTQRLLSSHPLYASVLILLNLGGSLDLGTMAKSVGAHPVKLHGMLLELVDKGLIRISDDDPPVVQAIMQ